jgi:hypothetical protein
MGIVRPARFDILDGEATWSEDGVTTTVKVSDAKGRNLTPTLRQIKDPKRDWVPSAMQRANDELTRERKITPNVGGIIFAPDKERAREYAKVMGGICGEQVIVVYSEMDDDPYALIEQFTHGSQRWIVAVNMISEGVDIPRLVVGLYLSDYQTEMFIRQAHGRLVRKLSPNDNHKAVFMIPNVAELVEIVKRIEQESNEALKQRPEEPPPPPPPPGELRLIIDHGTSDAELAQIVYGNGTIFDSNALAMAEAIRQSRGLHGVNLGDICEIIEAIRSDGEQLQRMSAPQPFDRVRTPDEIREDLKDKAYGLAKSITGALLSEHGGKFGQIIPVVWGQAWESIGKPRNTKIENADEEMLRQVLDALMQRKNSLAP